MGVEGIIKAKCKFGLFGRLPHYNNSETTFIAKFALISYIMRKNTFNSPSQAEPKTYYGQFVAIGGGQQNPR